MHAVVAVQYLRVRACVRAATQNFRQRWGLVEICRALRNRLAACHVSVKDANRRYIRDTFG
jgi:hypothetical protein